MFTGCFDSCPVFPLCSPTPCVSPSSSYPLCISPLCRTVILFVRLSVTVFSSLSWIPRVSPVSHPQLLWACLLILNISTTTTCLLWCKSPFRFNNHQTNTPVLINRAYYVFSVTAGTVQIRSFSSSLPTSCLLCPLNEGKRPQKYVN